MPAFGRDMTNSLAFAIRTSTPWWCGEARKPLCGELASAIGVTNLHQFKRRDRVAVVFDEEFEVLHRAQGLSVWTSFSVHRRENMAAHNPDVCRRADIGQQTRQ